MQFSYMLILLEILFYSASACFVLSVPVLRKWLIAVALLPVAAFAETNDLPAAARNGIVDGIMGTGRAALEMLTGTTPQWVNVKGRDTEDCMKLSNGIIDDTFVKCRNGYKVRARKRLDGSIEILEIKSL